MSVSPAVIAPLELAGKQAAAADAVGEATLDLLQRFPAYSALIWERVSSLVPMEGQVLELGCGIGSISRLILASGGVVSLDAVDLEAAYIARLRGEVHDARLRAMCVPAETLVAETGRYDRAVSINVLEHIEDDVAALTTLAHALRPGGLCAILVPAHPSLFSSLDRGLSHFRRYTRASLASVARRAGLVPERVVHFNPLGAVGWWLNGRVLHRTVLPAGQVAAYATVGIWLSRLLDRVNPFPLGISLVARLRKPS